MSRKRNRKSKELFYTELRIAGGVNLFIQPLITHKIISGLKWCCEKRGLRIYEYTVLPDRMVMIANTAWGTLPEVLETFKNFTSKAAMLILREGRSPSWMMPVFREKGPQGKPEGLHIWEEEPLIYSLYKQDEIDEYALAIHNRSVKMGLVAKPEHYLNCSANPRNPLDGWVVEATDPWS